MVGDGSSGTSPEWLKLYEAGVQWYRRREFATAAEQFEASLQLQPGDALGEMYLQRCRNYVATPPDDAWNGVYVMTKK